MTTPKPCTCPRARHRHGTHGAYNRDRCRCLPCRLAHSDQRKQGKLADPDMWVPRKGSVLRLNALAYLGWSDAAIGAVMGRDKRGISDIRCRRQEHILRSTAERVTEAYEQLWDKKPPERTRLEKRLATLARNRARQAGAVPPMALDDDRIDDPEYQPAPIRTGGGWDRQPCGTEAAARRHRRRGEPLDRACLRSETRRGRERAHDRKRAA